MTVGIVLSCTQKWTTVTEDLFNLSQLSHPWFGMHAPSKLELLAYHWWFWIYATLMVLMKQSILTGRGLEARVGRSELVQSSSINMFLGSSSSPQRSLFSRPVRSMWQSNGNQISVKWESNISQIWQMGIKYWSNGDQISVKWQMGIK